MKTLIENFEKNALTRKEMKEIGGGFGCKSGSCTLVIIGHDGQTMSVDGHCTSPLGAYNCYCETGYGPLKLSSNGGISRCTA